MTIKEELIQELEQVPETELVKVLEFVRALKSTTPRTHYGKLISPQSGSERRCTVALLTFNFLAHWRGDAKENSRIKGGVA